MVHSEGTVVTDDIAGDSGTIQDLDRSVADAPSGYHRGDAAFPQALQDLVDGGAQYGVVARQSAVHVESRQLSGFKFGSRDMLFLHTQYLFIS